MTRGDPAQPSGIDYSPGLAPDLAMSSPTTPSDQRDDLSSLVTRCILAFEQEGETAVDGLLRANPALAAAAREQLLALRDAGLLVPPLPDPEHIGHYRILRKLGTGGVGSVYLAEQQQPMRRQVALKVIRPGMDSREVLARFAIERQALALLDHPNVARVLDAGATADGRPYLCMDYVAGMPITRYCDERALSLSDRLTLLAQVCDAVHAAHQKGILHRDLKPSNILVGDRDGRPWPTVIDFGVAKSLGPRLLDVTLMTGHGRLVGTPEYMSPEQAANEIDVDTRTDVHALGVVLYELLTGILPFASDRLRRADSGELVRILREEEPLPPSAVVARGDAGEDTRAARRRTSPRALHRSLHGELDWIVQKAIERDRNRRYGMAADLADDLRAHLADEPIRAGPPSAWYRWRKFARRHRLQVGSVAGVLFALLGGLLASLFFYGEAMAKAQQSEASLDVALAAVERMVQAGEDRLNVVPRMEEVRRELLTEALELHRRLANAAGGRALQLRTARALAGLAEVQAQLGDYEHAIASAEEARGTLDRLRAARGDDGADRAMEELRIGLLFSQAMWMGSQGQPEARCGERIEAARQGVERLLDSAEPDARFRLLAAKVLAGCADRRRGADAATARDWFERATGLLEPVLEAPAAHAEQLPQAFSVMARHAQFLVDVGEPPLAIAAADRLHKLVAAELRRDPDPLRQARHLPTLMLLGTVWYRSEQHARVVAELDTVIAARQALARDFPAVPVHRSELGAARVNSALALEKLGRLDEAQTHLEQALALFRELVEQHPAVLDHHEQLLRAAINLAHNSTMRTRYGMPVNWPIAERAIAEGRAVAGRVPGDQQRRLRASLAELARVHGVVASQQGKHAEAAEAQREALGHYESLHADEPGSIWHGSRLIDVRENLARTLLHLGDPDAAARLVESATRLQSELAPKLASKALVADKRRDLCELGVRIDLERGHFDAALAGMERYLELAPAPTIDWRGQDLVASLALVGVRKTAGDDAWRTRFAARARSAIDDGTALAERGGIPTPPMVAVMRANSLQIRVALEREVGDTAAAIAAQQGVVADYRIAFDARRNARNRARVAAALQTLAELQRAAGDAAGAARTEADLAALPPADG